jgi:hypothetical protein
MAERKTRRDVTEEVGSEGGSPGDVEVTRDHGAPTGSEATTTWRRSDAKTRTILRDEAGDGRRSP